MASLSAASQILGDFPPTKHKSWGQGWITEPVAALPQAWSVPVPAQETLTGESLTGASS